MSKKEMELLIGCCSDMMASIKSCMQARMFLRQDPDNPDYRSSVKQCMTKVQANCCRLRRGAEHPAFYQTYFECTICGKTRGNGCTCFCPICAKKPDRRINP